MLLLDQDHFVSRLRVEVAFSFDQEVLATSGGDFEVRAVGAAPGRPDVVEDASLVFDGKTRVLDLLG